MVERHSFLKTGRGSWKMAALEVAGMAMKTAKRSARANRAMYSDFLKLKA